MSIPPSEFARLVEPGMIETFSVFGPTLEFLTPMEADAPCIMRGTIPAGMVVPLHSHPEPETFIALSGEIEGLAELPSGGFEWTPVRSGDVFHVPGGAKHAWRNRSSEPAISIVVTAQSLGRFFREVGTPIGLGEPATTIPSQQALQHFLATAERYGYWNATPEENAEVGLVLPM